MTKDNVYRRQRAEHGEPVQPVDPKHEPIPKGALCQVCEGSAMWMPSLSNVRFCVKCYPVHVDFSSARVCDTDDELMPIDMGSDIEETAPMVPIVTKQEPINRNAILSGILGATYKPTGNKYSVFEGDDA